MNLSGNDILSFLIALIFSLYVVVLFLRFFLQWHQVNLHNPLNQFVAKFTDPIVRPLRRIIPDVANIGLSIIVILFFLEAVKLSLLFLLEEKHLPDLLTLGGVTIASLINQLLNFFLYAILIRVILSWLMSSTPQSILNALYIITETILRPVRNVIPTLAGFDVSPLVTIVCLLLISNIIVEPFMVL